MKVVIDQASDTLLTMPPPSLSAIARAVALALRMRAAQRDYYSLAHLDPRKREALRQAQMLEREFDRLTARWKVE